MKNKTVTISFKSLWYLFTALALSIICVGGYSPYFTNTRTFLALGLAACSVVVALFVRRRILFDASLALFTLAAIYMVFSAALSLDVDTGMEVAFYYVFGLALMLIEYSEKQIETVIKCFVVFTLVIALSIIISVFIDDCMNKYFSWFLNPSGSASVARAMSDILRTSHAYAGFAMEKGEAAYIMGMGICVMLSRMFSGAKVRWQDVLCLVIELAALLLTSKRMILICLVPVFALLMLVSKIKGKIMKSAIILLLAAVAVFVIISFVPSMSNVFYRLTNETDDTLTGRSGLWAFSIMMFSKSPIFGMGIGAFNEFASDYGYTGSSGNEWTAFGHNCYYELLGEIGIVGCLILFGAILYMLVKTFKLAAADGLSVKRRSHVLFALSVEVMLLLYAITGNVFLYFDQTFALFFAFAIVRSVSINLGFTRVLGLKGRLRGGAYR